MARNGISSNTAKDLLEGSGGNDHRLGNNGDDRNAGLSAGSNGDGMGAGTLIAIVHVRDRRLISNDDFFDL